VFDVSVAGKQVIFSSLKSKTYIFCIITNLLFLILYSENRPLAPESSPLAIPSSAFYQRMPGSIRAQINPRNNFFVANDDLRLLPPVKMGMSFEPILATSPALVESVSPKGMYEQNVFILLNGIFINRIIHIALIIANIYYRNITNIYFL
jgi:hypothetical protein